MKTRLGEVNLRKCLTRLKLGTGVLILCISGGTLAAASDFCRSTSSKLLDSCQDGAESDYRLALAKCDNVSDPAARATCQQTAAADFSDARQTCRDQHDARQAACQELGPDRYDPVINPANFVHHINNPYFPLVPGTTFVYEGHTAAGLEHDEFAVTHRTRVILGVTCIEVHDTVRVNGELTEDTLDWFAQDIMGNVWYFGENTHELVDGLITTIDGTFMAGEDGAKPGIIMKAHPMIGDFYRQEFALDNAEDFAETVSLNASVTVGHPPHTYNHCLKSQETTPLETDLLEYKFFAPGVGNVLTVDGHTGERIELVRITTN
jgi:hypothetical protein